MSVYLEFRNKMERQWKGSENDSDRNKDNDGCNIACYAHNEGDCGSRGRSS